MSALHLATPARLDTDGTEAHGTEAVRANSMGSHRLDDWACGLNGSSAHRAGERCRDVSPELIIELL